MPGTVDVEVDVVIAGAGPAGLALAGELTALGVSVLVVDPHPDRPWRATHCGWLDELRQAPGFDARRSVRRHLPHTVVRDRHGTETALGRDYVLLDPAGARNHLRDRACAGRGSYAETAGRIDTARASTARGGGARSGDGALTIVAGDHEVTARLLVDAAGAGSTLAADGRKPASDAALWQWAAGIVAELDVEPVPPGGAVVMDWTAGLPAAGEAPGIPRSFGYVLDLGDGTHLVEETVLAGPRVQGVLRSLRSRLAARLSGQGIGVREVRGTESVAIPLDVGIRRAHHGVLPIGVAAGTVHPASGYSVTAALRTAPGVAAAVAAALSAGQSPAAVATAGSAALWTPSRRLAQRTLDRGLRTTLGLPPDELADFFGAFFALGADRWAPYLEQPPRALGVAATMTRLFGVLPPRSRRGLATRWLTAGRPPETTVDDPDVGAEPDHADTPRGLTPDHRPRL